MERSFAQRLSARCNLLATVECTRGKVCRIVLKHSGTSGWRRLDFCVHPQAFFSLTGSLTLLVLKVTSFVGQALSMCSCWAFHPCYNQLHKITLATNKTSLKRYAALGIVSHPHAHCILTLTTLTLVPCVCAVVIHIWEKALHLLFTNKNQRTIVLVKINAKVWERW